MNTPWGPSQTVEQIAPGIVSVSTAGHGGFNLSPERWRELSDSFIFFSYAGRYWLEEDCDVALAVIRWPELFCGDMVFSCVRLIRSGFMTHGEHAQSWLASPAGEPARAKAATFQASVDGQWERGGMSGDGDGWVVDFTRGTECRQGLFASYPGRHWFFTAEVDEAAERLARLVARKAREKLARESRALDAIPRRRVAVDFDEAQCGGVFDGVNTVYSDADPGL